MLRQGAIVRLSIVASRRRPGKTENVQPLDIEEEEDEVGPGHLVSKTYSDDAEAEWTMKGKTACYGCKLHVATDAEHGFIIGDHDTASQPTGRTPKG